MQVMRDPYYWDSWYWALMDALPFAILLLGIFFILFLFMKKDNSKLWENFGHNLKVFYLYMAAFVGMVITLIAGINLTSQALETAVFGVEYDYVDYWQCDYASGKGGYYDAELTDLLTDEEYEECKANALEKAKEDYINTAKRTYASGLAGLLFGLVVWIPHFVWARRIK